MRLLGRAHLGLPRYMCVKDPGKPGCGRIAVYAHLAEPEAWDKISRKEWATAKRVLDDQASQLTMRITRSVQARALAEFAALEGDMWEQWEHPQMIDSARRALILACCHAVDVNPRHTRQAVEPRPHRPRLDRLTPPALVAAGTRPAGRPAHRELRTNWIVHLWQWPVLPALARGTAEAHPGRCRMSPFPAANS
ncbi:MAG: hypothetical protein ACRDNF_07690 [Streptosporangiaceae bacterium]